MSHTSDIKILPRAVRSQYTGSPFDSTDILSIKVSVAFSIPQLRHNMSRAVCKWVGCWIETCVFSVAFESLQTSSRTPSRLGHGQLQITMQASFSFLSEFVYT